MIALWCFFLGFTASPVLRAEASATKLQLTDSIQVTLTIEGDSPLRVEAPSEWLLEAIPWRAKLLASPTLAELPGERSRWQAKLKLIADAPSDKWLVQLRAVRVQAGQGLAQELSFTPLEFEVRSSRTTEEIRGPMDVEEAPVAQKNSLAKVWYILAGGLIVVTSLSSVVWAKRRRRSGDSALSPADKLRRELDRLSQSNISDPDFAEGLANALRRFLEQTRGFPATQRTTGELAPWLIDNALTELIQVLSRCDEVRFAGQNLMKLEREELLQSCQQQVLAMPA
jgi:hypothetical protein